MKKNIKSRIFIILLSFAFALTGCNFSANNQEKAKKQNTNTPADTSSIDTPDDADLGLDSSELPLTLQAITAGRIILSGKDSFERISIQKGNGLIFDAADNIDVQPGDTIRFYGINYKYVSDNPADIYYSGKAGEVNLTIDCTADCYVYGNAMSLLYYTNFKGKTQITQNYVLQKLFLNNTHIKNHETLDIVLPATTLSEGCYKKMFYGCTGLTRAPELPAATLTENCYSYMFFNCKNLNSIKCMAANISAKGSTESWIANVAGTGSFTSIQENSIWRVKDKYSGIPKGWTANPPFNVVNAYELPLTLEALEDGNITLTSFNRYPDLQYSINGQEKQSAKNQIEIFAGDTICFYATGKGDDNMFGLRIDCSNDCCIYGNIMSLLYSEDFSDKTAIKNKYEFSQMFENNEHIKNCSIDLVLPATDLEDFCYDAMFAGCKGITIAPELPATSLSMYCYSEMFKNCTSLTSAPELKATKLAPNCYYFMFNGCTSLIAAPDLLAVEMKDYCYSSMFSGCSSLIKAPKIEATTLAESCCSGMFGGCKSLTTAPELKAFTMAKSCYSNMFQGCTSLTIAPELKATKLEESCYSNMFNGCTSLTIAPELSCTQLKDSCYMYMFINCQSLIKAPDLLATSLAPNCYSGMFQQCSSLTSAPELPATTLATSCYENMFNECTSLTVAPELPATTLTSTCYKKMFYKCKSLRSAPYLPATEMSNNCYDCYNSMFSGCEKLSSIVCNVETVTSGNLYYNYCTSWTTEVASYGILITSPDAGSSVWNSNYIIPSTWTKTTQFPLTIDVIKDGKITIKNAYKFTNMKYSKNFEAPQTLPSDSVTFDIDVSAGDKISFYADNNNTNDDKYMNINCSSECYLYGNIMSLVDSANYTIVSSLTVQKCFSSLFKDNSNIKNHPNYKILLPATTLVSACYNGLFEGCSGLTVAPDLPATSLTSDCYQNMFKGCTSLTATPSFKGTTLAQRCYSNMFEGCTSLITVEQLSATSLVSSCYYEMFKGCTSLTTPPQIDATGLANNCYQGMFSDCTSLLTAPTLSAETMKDECYKEMFKNCKSLTAAPQLNANTVAQRCYQEMFSGCSNLTTAPTTLPATTLENNCYRDMFLNCTSLTSAPLLPATDLNTANYCYYEMFKGCKSLISAPALPATYLAYHCYESMFEGCISLTTAPVLSATTLVAGCYSSMFKNCTNLNYIKCLATSLNQSVSCTNDWVYGVSETGTFVKAASMNNWDSGRNGIPTGWTVEVAN